MFRFETRFARGRIEDSSFNRFALNGIQGIACFIVFYSLFERLKKIRKRRRTVRRRNGGAEMALPHLGGVVDKVFHRFHSLETLPVS